VTPPCGDSTSRPGTDVWHVDRTFGHQTDDITPTTTWRQDAATCPVAWSQAQGAAVGPVSPVDHALVFTVGAAVRKLLVTG
jgi:hypothetical protein